MSKVLAVAKPNVAEKATAFLANAGMIILTRPGVYGTGLAEMASLVHGFNYDMPKTRRS